MHRLRALITTSLIAFLLLFATVKVLASPSESSRSVYVPPYASKIELDERLALFVDLIIDGEASFLIVLDKQADLSAASGIVGKEAKGRFVFETLRDMAVQTQPELIELLRAQGASVRPFIIINAIGVLGDIGALNAAVASSYTQHIIADRNIRTMLPQPSIQRQPSQASAIEWGVNFVNAPLVWAMGYSGTGIVIGGQDTGVRWEHDALKNQYRGWDGAIANHDYNWHDSIHTATSNPCGVDSSVPCDDFGHGTHTVGTMIGDDGAGNQIGVAPGAEWIACRNMNKGFGTPTTYLECFEWFVAPYPITGTIFDGDPSQAPHIINNSWACPPSEGCLVGHEVISGVQAVRAAGILPVVSAGNSGSGGCSTVKYPPAIYAESFSIGAHDSGGNIASFSSRGPVTLDGSGRMKPDMAAPGVNVRSTTNGSNSAYGNSSGTSMAGPHVAGVAALLWSAAPYLIGEVDLTEWVLRLNASAAFTSQGCGGDTPVQRPNNVWGWGKIDAQAAVSATFSLTPTARLSSTILTGGVLVLDASASSDPESPVSELLARWDLENDGVWDTPWSLDKVYTGTTATVSISAVVQIADTGGRSDISSIMPLDQHIYLPLTLVD